MGQKKKSLKKSSGQGSTQTSGSQGAPQKSPAQEPAVQTNGVPESSKAENSEGQWQRASLIASPTMSTYQGLMSSNAYFIALCHPWATLIYLIDPVLDVAVYQASFNQIRVPAAAQQRCICPCHRLVSFLTCGPNSKSLAMAMACLSQ